MNHDYSNDDHSTIQDPLPSLVLEGLTLVNEGVQVLIEARGESLELAMVRAATNTMLDDVLGFLQAAGIDTFDLVSGVWDIIEPVEDRS